MYHKEIIKTEKGDVLQKSILVKDKVIGKPMQFFETDIDKMIVVYTSKLEELQAEKLLFKK